VPRSADPPAPVADPGPDPGSEIDLFDDVEVEEGKLDLLA
jgi:hypothetical protein